MDLTPRIIGRTQPLASPTPSLDGGLVDIYAPPAMQTIFRYVLAVTLLSLSGSCAQTASGSPDGGVNPDSRPTTYYVIRHAEREPADDPPLNEEGMARAERLADALEKAGVEEIIATLFRRGQETGEPLSDRTGAPITVAPVERADWPQMATEVAAWQLDREVVGSTYLMIGHAGRYNTTLLQELGAPPSGILGERYQDMVILIREPDGSVRLSILEYGGPSSKDP